MNWVLWGLRQIRFDDTQDHNAPVVHIRAQTIAMASAVLVGLSIISLPLGMRDGRAEQRNEIKSEDYIEEGPSTVLWEDRREPGPK